MPVPLTSTRFAVTIRGGIAAVETWRTIRNAESRSIEVTLTVPMPVRAVLYALDLEDGGRVVKGAALNRQMARERYEEAGQEGQRAVLHEEVLCGVHMVSIMHLAPGAEVTVRCAWAAFLAPASPGRAGLRIPLTVGDIYGRSPLPDSDDLVSGGARGWARVTVDADDVEVLSGGRRCAAPFDVPLDRPLDLLVPARFWPTLNATTRSGRRVSLAIAIEQVRDRSIEACILIDRSGSMDEPCTAAFSGVTKYEAVCAGLVDAAAALTESDDLRLYAFDTVCEALGSAKSQAACRLALDAAGGPRGGTEIGAALRSALADSRARDILVITDGKSHALDTAALVRSGRRFTVVLIGDDSLEANVGHLAASSGGALIVARGTAVADAVVAALASLRLPHTVEPVIEGPLRRVIARQDGLVLEALWDDEAAANGEVADAIRALASALAVPRLPDAQARALAQQEGLVGRFTSLVLVDEDAERQESLALSRKVALARPSAAASPRAAPEPACAIPAARPASSGSVDVPDFLRNESAPREASTSQPPASRDDLGPRPPRGRLTGKPPAPALPGTAPEANGPAPRWPRVDLRIWAGYLDALSRGDLGLLPPDIATVIAASTADPAICRAAAKLGLSPTRLVIGILARRDAPEDRSAQRIERAIFRGIDEDVVRSVLAGLTV